jgi:hypothetical protein
MDGRHLAHLAALGLIVTASQPVTALATVSRPEFNDVIDLFGFANTAIDATSIELACSGGPFDELGQWPMRFISCL